ncbi:MAG TPA: hypothetical protein VF099_07400, partial [Ktedonobacterales bacterium]
MGIVSKLHPIPTIMPLLSCHLFLPRSDLTTILTTMASVGARGVQVALASSGRAGQRYKRP